MTSGLRLMFALLALAFLPLLIKSDFALTILVFSFLIGMLAVSFNLIFGYTGQLSMFHAAAFGISAYATHLSMSLLGTSFWIGLVLGALLVVVMWTWVRGTQILTAKTRKDSLPLNDLIEMLQARPPHRAPCMAIFLTSDPDVAPVALMHNLKHNKVLHEKNVILTVRTSERPRVKEADRVRMEPINDDFKKVTVTYGFMETPNVPRALGLCRKQGLKFDIMSTSFFLGRRSLIPSARQGMPLWQDKLFIFLMRNAANPTDFFHIPPGRVVELGAQVAV